MKIFQGIGLCNGILTLARERREGGAVILDVSGKCGLVGEILLENWDGGRVGEIILF